MTLTLLLHIAELRDDVASLDVEHPDMPDAARAELQDAYERLVDAHAYVEKQLRAEQ